MNLRERLVLFLLGLFFLMQLANANLVFPVERKFKAPHQSLGAIKAHDARRRGRFLSAVDVPLGGNGHPSSTGLYYTKIGLGSPAKVYYVQVDTGSDILWVNCVGCTACPKKSGLGMELTLYDPKESKTSKMVRCDDEFCSSLYDGQVSPCGQGTNCPYGITYGDGSQTSGSFMKDYLTFDRVNGNLHTTPGNSTVIFGCGSKQSGTLGKSTGESLDGIIGFGQSNSSVLSQLAAAGKVKRIFSHCLDNINGGGIYAIGEVVQPKVNTTSLIPRMAHYNVVLKDMEVNGDPIQLPTDIFDSSNGRGTIIDSGTTLAYLPATVYDQLVEKILAGQNGLKLYLVENQFTCFEYDKKVDDGFPVVKFHFEDGLSLTAYPHDYLFLTKENKWCIGWQKSMTQTKDGKDIMLLGADGKFTTYKILPGITFGEKSFLHFSFNLYLRFYNGDLVLSNKLVVYDLENMVIGWTDYNCSSSIKVKDESTGSVYTVGAHDLSSASTVLIGKILTFFLLIIAMLST